MLRKDFDVAIGRPWSKTLRVKNDDVLVDLSTDTLKFVYDDIVLEPGNGLTITLGQIDIAIPDTSSFEEGPKQEFKFYRAIGSNPLREVFGGYLIGVVEPNV